MGQLAELIAHMGFKEKEFLDLKNELEERVEQRTVEIRNALSEIKTLRRILPLCSFCKKIRDDQGYWEEVDVYMYKHLDARISHGACPECLQKNYPEIFADIEKEKETQKNQRDEP